MIKNYGVDRVLEPKGVVPAAAWKLDNDKAVRSKELRVSLERIHLEWDNFQQITNSCGFDEDKIKAKIMDIVEKRGKLNNPFTGTGGVLIGTIDEMAEDLHSESGLTVGDRIYSITSLCCLPIYIEEITEIDYQYGQIECKGYGILFEATPAYLMEEDLDANYTLAAMDEAGNMFGAYNIATTNNNKNVVIIGRNIYSTILYAAALREAIGPEYRVEAIMDNGAKNGLSEEEIRNVMYPLIKETHFTDLMEPLKTFKTLSGKDKHFLAVDQVIVTEDILGAETLAVMLVKNHGDLYFVAMENHYATAQLIAESMGKAITMYAFDQYIEDYPAFTTRMIRSIKPKLEEVNKLYEKTEKQKKASRSRTKTADVYNAGKEDDFIYQSRVTKAMIDEVMNVAKYDCNVIIQGETGVGKEKVLSLIHQNSERHGNPCIKINCATIQESLAESEFFGYESGAFTGAQSSGKPGYFELANNGILFLDEIGTLSMNMQSKLLRVLQENQFYRVGGTTQQSVNVRVIVANNVPLKELVDQGKFREDLYYRLNICKIDVPALRDRKDDIVCLAEAFVANWTKKYKMEKVLAPEALSQLYDYYWPGNVRELENVIHRLVISSKDVVITQEDVEEILNENAYGDLVVSVKKNFNRSEELDFHQLMEQQEKQIIEYALKKEGKTRKAAELLGLPQTTFVRKKLKHGL